MKKILIIDDEDKLRENLAEILELHGYTTYQANDGISGITTAMAVNPDVILCDVMMPNATGYDFLNNLKKTHLNHTPVIFVTAKIEREDERYGMNLGADDYIKKPFHINEVIASIEARLNKVSEFKSFVFSKITEQAKEFASLLNGHEIRTQLNIISGMSVLLTDLVKEDYKKQANQMMQYIEGALQNILNLLNSLQMHELLRSNKDEELMNEYNINIESNLKLLAQKFSRKINLKVMGEENIPSKLKFQFAYVCSELTVNAIKFSPSTSVIDAVIAIDKKIATVTVTNAGTYSELLKDKIAPFTKHKSSTSTPGFGLGLNNIKQIAQRNKGHFEIKQEPDIKTSITVIIPTH